VLPPMATTALDCGRLSPNRPENQVKSPSERERGATPTPSSRDETAYVQTNAWTIPPRRLDRHIGGVDRSAGELQREQPCLRTLRSSSREMASSVPESPRQEGANLGAQFEDLELFVLVIVRSEHPLKECHLPLAGGEHIRIRPTGCSSKPPSEAT
jgi:hypothetical protein